MVSVPKLRVRKRILQTSLDHNSDLQDHYFNAAYSSSHFCALIFLFVFPSKILSVLNQVRETKEGIYNTLVWSGLNKEVHMSVAKLTMLNVPLGG